VTRLTKFVATVIVLPFTFLYYLNKFVIRYMYFSGETLVSILKGTQ